MAVSSVSKPGLQKNELAEVLGTTRTAFVAVAVFSLFINLLMLTAPILLARGLAAGVSDGDGCDSRTGYVRT